MLPLRLLQPKLLRLKRRRKANRLSDSNDGSSSGRPKAGHWFFTGFYLLTPSLSLVVSIRTFLAVAIDREPVQAIGRLLSQLRPRSSGVRWVDPKNFHITLAFLGEVATERLPELFQSVEAVCALHEPFDLSLESFGAFPSQRRPRVIKIGAGEGAHALTRLANDLADELELLGYRKEQRPFAPHLTIGRVKGPIRLPGGTQKVFEELSSWVAGFSHVGEVLVMGSDRLPTGPVYSVLARFDLLGPDVPMTR